MKKRSIIEWEVKVTGPPEKYAYASLDYTITSGEHGWGLLYRDGPPYLVGFFLTLEEAKQAAETDLCGK